MSWERRLVQVITNHPMMGDTLAMLPGLSGAPILGVPGHLHLFVELINLFQAQSLGLIDEEPDKGDAQEATAKPDEEDLGLEVGVATAVVDKVRRGIGNGPVEEPIGGSGHAERLGTRLEGEDFASDDPGERTPC